ncbi:hypothetical protein MtrunA17_Chr3g0103921 [Medicago truncatula]|uniref:Uncharacterized protein n=1 Tax=Medicago truncatula TaxID=3880 RepID=A0A396IST3_MEDTR|nr:uncharacterized protein LOC120579758 isoform X2 [Medicago truncatula]RHN67553.1 hypothetical protein MtrunA17_Chr3g0103921 [Medicago truncatula]
MDDVSSNSLKSIDPESADYASQGPQVQQLGLFQCQGDQGQCLEQMITNAMIQISPAIAQAILANLAGNQHDPAMCLFRDQGLQHIVTNAMFHISPAIAQAILAVLTQQHQQFARNQHDPAMVNGGGGANLDGFVMSNDPFKHMWYARGVDGAPGPDSNAFHDLGLFGDGFDVVFEIALRNYNLGSCFADVRKGS